MRSKRLRSAVKLGLIFAVVAWCGTRGLTVFLGHARPVGLELSTAWTVAGVAFVTGFATGMVFD
jgi:hypothetical protein